MEIKDRGTLHLGLSDAAASAKYVRQAADQADSAAQYARQAQGFAQRAESLADAAAEAVEYYPRISSGFWQVWDAERREYVSTGVKAQGERGPRGDPGPGPNRNLLDNWYFIGGGSQLGDGVFPINQRGQASYSGDVACFDRWALRSSGTTVTLTETGLILTSSAQTGGIIYQMIENPKLLLGKKVCYSLLAGGNLYSGAAQFDAAAPSGNKTVLTVPINDGFSLRIRHLANGGIEVGIIRNGGTLSDIQAIKLELGDTQTIAHQEGGNWVLNELPDYGEELAKCQRYFLPLMEFVRYNATLRTENLVDFTIPTPVTMAGRIKMVAPNIKIYSYVEGETALKEQTGFSFSTDSDGSIIATATGSGNGIVTIRATKNGHGLLANPCILLFPGSGAYLTVT